MKHLLVTLCFFTGMLASLFSQKLTIPDEVQIDSLIHQTYRKLDALNDSGYYYLMPVCTQQDSSCFVDYDGLKRQLMLVDAFDTPFIEGVIEGYKTTIPKTRYFDDYEMCYSEVFIDDSATYQVLFARIYGHLGSYFNEMSADEIVVRKNKASAKVYLFYYYSYTDDEKGQNIETGSACMVKLSFVKKSYGWRISGAEPVWE